MDTNLQPGDKVRLKSGGPLMTISDIEDGIAECQFFNGGEYFEKEFPLTSLEKPDESSPIGGIRFGGAPRNNRY